MASYHCTATIGGAGASAGHADYIGRDGKHKKKPGDDDLEAAGHGNLPSWARTPRSFWQAADEFERVNGSTYRELVVALPRELTPLQRCDLVEDFIRQELGGKHAFQWGIHNPKASLEGGEQPHAHIMYSERILDGVERPREQFFKRYNGKDPAKGGCKKASGGKTKDENVAALLVTRERWARVQNEHLARHSHDARVDHRSLKNQGIEREPERHLGQAQIQTQSEAVDRVLAARADRTLAATLKTAIDAAQRRLTRLHAVARAVLEKAARKVAPRVPEVVKAAGPDQVDELADFLQMRSARLLEVVKSGERLEASSKETSQREIARAESLRKQIEAMQLPGLLSSKATKQRHGDRVAKIMSQGQAAVDADRAAQKAAAQGRAMQSKPLVFADAAIERDHPGLVARMLPLAQDPKLVELARQRLEERRQSAQSTWKLNEDLKAFKTHALRREMKFHGYGDQGPAWQALPVMLRDKIEAFNRLGKEARPVALERLRQALVQDPAEAQKLAVQLQAAKGKAPGMSR
ncbi:MobA/MobL family protein [Variovorax sp. J22P271]|uniref:MobA/MobL family protein n=1 Tax=Variovorax davisae TaxID=3053515 RepID=UPI0025770489|nr:MobA/MobL family protein [Variovorax sp. J22P271]MDM0037324.1 MobA/MobL family protein [Variovorax sp. J22P271]